MPPRHLIATICAAGAIRGTLSFTRKSFCPRKKRRFFPHLRSLSDLSLMLKAADFEDIQVVTATLSRIPGWTSYELDSGPDGQPLKPDSLYVEAMKP